MLTQFLALPFALAVVDDPKAASSDQAFAAEQAKVAIELCREFERASGNVIFSPFSIARALAMTREGAAGETAAELDRVLRYPKDVGAAFGSLAAALKPLDVGADDQRHALYVIELATSMWGRSGQSFDAGFTARLKSGFASELFSTDFHAPETARAAINEWTSKHTAGRIAEIIPAGVLKSDTRLVLVDTIRFKANWEEAFSPGATRPEPFLVASGKTVDAPSMHRTDHYAYGESELARIIELPYERGATSMFVVLPKHVDTLAAVIAREDVARWTASLVPRRIELALPKFRFEWADDVTPALGALGIHAAFDAAHADFSRILADPLSVDAVFHRAFVAVDERGTEAAAATASVMRPGAAVGNSEAPLAFHVDRPFLFFIRHRMTGAVLFLGRVADPTAG